jgi:hypothetical protein
MENTAPLIDWTRKVPGPKAKTEIRRFSSRQDFEDDGCMVAVERAGS